MDAAALQVAQELAHQRHVVGLQVMVVAEAVQVLLRDDQPVRAVGQDVLLAQAVGAPPHRLQRQVEEARQRRARHALLDGVGLDRVDRGELPVERLVAHHVDDVGIEHGVDDQQIQRIEIVMPEQLADGAQDVGQRMPRHHPGAVVGLKDLLLHAALLSERCGIAMTVLRLTRARARQLPNPGSHPLEKYPAATHNGGSSTDCGPIRWGRISARPGA